MTLTKAKKCEIVKIIYKLLSITLAFLSSMMWWYWNMGAWIDRNDKEWFTLNCIALAYSVTYWFFAEMYRAFKIGIYRLTELTLFQFLAFGMSDVVLLVEIIVWHHGFEKVNFLAFILVFFLQMVSSVVMIYVCNKIHARYDEPRKIMIVYGNENYLQFLDKLNSKKYRYNVIKCIPENEDVETIKEFAEQCFGVYLYEVRENLKNEIVVYCREKNIKLYITQTIEELLIRGFEVSHTFDTPFVRTKKENISWYYPIVKRVIDILFSVLGLIILSPVFLIVACMIKAYDGGPVLYKQIRLTKGHKEFTIYKFRSMIVDAEKKGAQLSTAVDDRITPIGRVIRATRIDELPQLINILKGDMSIIGPRPERPEIEKEYLKALPEYAFRLEVPAGLSGYAQVFGKYNTNPSDKLKLDLLYINNRSIMLDLKLILYTVKIIFIPETTEGV